MKGLQKNIVILLFLIVFSTLILPPVDAQIGHQYQQANELIQEEKYEQAYAILHDLIEKYPNSFPIYDRTITCLVHLKKYNRAIQLTKDRLHGSYKNVVMAVRLGKLYHLAGDSSKANSIWENTLKQNASQVQTYRYIAETMQDSREYSRATKIYKLARKRFNNPALFLFEMANNYLQAGEYKEAIDEFLHLIKVDKSRLAFVEHQLRQYNDKYIYTVATQTTEQADQAFSTDKDYRIALKKLLIWLYLEQNRDKKALVTAIKLEPLIKSGHYPVFDVAKKLRSDNKFKLAEEAYSYYVKHPQHDLAARSLEEMAKLDIRWAEYLSEYNIDFTHKSDSLYHQAYQKSEELTNNYPTYDRLSNILVLQAELALNHIKNLDSAQSYVGKLEHLPGHQKSEALINYLRGRILLYKGNFDRARVYFTRSRKKAHSGPLADKDRYYLSLTDFYAGDYDFAKIQIESLEKDHTSLYANDALQLRMWIQDGINKDSTTTQLDTFSKAQFLYDKGATPAALDTLSTYIIHPVYHPLQDDMTLFAIKMLRAQHPVSAFVIADNFLRTQYFQGPLLERLLWERAQLALRLHTDRSFQKKLDDSKFYPNLPGFLKDQKNNFFDEQVRKRLIEATKNKQKVIALFEQILVHYPRGFYAEFTRNQIRNLQKENAS